MKNSIKYLIFSSCFMLAFILIVLHILGNIERKGYLGDFNINENGTLNLKNTGLYSYTFRIKYYSKVFKNSDIYGVYPTLENVPQCINEIKFDESGSPFGSLISSKKLGQYDEINSISYRLKIKYLNILKYAGIFICIIMSILLISKIFIKLSKYFIRVLKNKDKYQLSFIFISCILLFLFVLQYLLKIKFESLGNISSIFIIAIIILLIKSFLDFDKSNQNFTSYRKLSNKSKILIFIICALVISFSYLFILNFHYPFVGHDFSLIIPRANSAFLYAKKNGLFSMELASPLFGGGLLSYPNPQYDQFSVFYFIRYLSHFWNAYLISVFLFTIIGFVSCYFALTDILKCNYEISLTGAVLFSCTGYYIHHLLVGHWAFLYHPLTALIVWLSFSYRFNYAIRISLCSLAFSMMIFGGALQTIFFFTCFTLIAIATILFEANIKFFNNCLVIIASSILGITLSLSKFMQSVYMGKSIDRGPWGLYDDKLSRLLTNLYYTFIYPIFSIFQKGNDTGRLIWEDDLAFPILLILILLTLFFKFVSKDKINIFIKNNKLKSIFFVLFFVLYADMFFAHGIIRSLIPKLRAVNFHLRLASVWILPVIFIFSMSLKKVIPNIREKKLFFIMINFITIFLFIDKFIYISVNNGAYRNINIEKDVEVWNNINKNYDKYYVYDIKETGDFQNQIDFLDKSGQLSSSRFPYEPIYGYGLETFKAKEKGSPYKIVNGRYNFNNPKHLLSFNEDNPQFSGFKLEENENLEKFLQFEEIDWNLPKIFKIFDTVSIISHILLFSFLIIYFIIFISKKLLKRKKLF